VPRFASALWALTWAYTLRGCPLFPRHPIHPVRQSYPNRLLPHCHPATLRHSARRFILRPYQRNQECGSQIREPMLAARARCLSRQPLPPQVPAKVIADLQHPLAVHLLQRDPAIADHFSRRLQLHCPQPVPSRFISPPIAIDPFLHRRPIKAHREVPHGHRIGDHPGQRICVSRDKLTKRQPRSFENSLHGKTPGELRPTVSRVRVRTFGR
jgi:hypothetical protein